VIRRRRWGVRPQAACGWGRGEGLRKTTRRRSSSSSSNSSRKVEEVREEWKVGGKEGMVHVCVGCVVA